MSYMTDTILDYRILEGFMMFKSQLRMIDEEGFRIRSILHIHDRASETVTPFIVYICVYKFRYTLHWI